MSQPALPQKRLAVLDESRRDVLRHVRTRRISSLQRMGKRKKARPLRTWPLG